MTSPWASIEDFITGNLERESQEREHLWRVVEAHTVRVAATGKCLACGEPYPCGALREAASRWSDRPGFGPSWGSRGTDVGQPSAYQ